MSTPTSSNDQLREGARLLVTGGKRATLDAVAALKARQGMSSSAAPAVLDAVRAKAQVTLPIGALLGIIALHLPIASFAGLDLSYMNAPGSEGPVQLTVLALVLLGWGLNRLLRGRLRLIRTVTGVGALLVGIACAINGAGNLFGIGPSIGSFSLALSGLALLVAGYCTLRPGVAAPVTSSVDER